MSGPRVTDHALVRFLDRAGAMDVEGLRQQLETSLARAHAAARSISASDYLVKVDGLVVVVRGESVTSILPGDQSPARRAHALERPGEV